LGKFHFFSCGLNRQDGSLLQLHNHRLFGRFDRLYDFQWNFNRREENRRVGRLG